MEIRLQHIKNFVNFFSCNGNTPVMDKIDWSFGAFQLSQIHSSFITLSISPQSLGNDWFIFHFQVLTKPYIVLLKIVMNIE